MENPLTDAFRQIIRVMQNLEKPTTSHEVHSRSNIRYPEHKVETYMRTMARNGLIAFDTQTRTYSLISAKVVNVISTVKKNRLVKRYRPEKMTIPQKIFRLKCLIDLVSDENQALLISVIGDLKEFQELCKKIRVA